MFLSSNASRVESAFHKIIEVSSTGAYCAYKDVPGMGKLGRGPQPLTEARFVIP